MGGRGYCERGRVQRAGITIGYRGSSGGYVGEIRYRGGDGDGERDGDGDRERGGGYMGRG